MRELQRKQWYVLTILLLCTLALLSLLRTSTSTKTKNQMESRFLLNVVITQSTSILKLLYSKDQTLLIRGDSLLVLNLSLDIVNGVTGLDIQSNCLSRKSLDKDLHTTTKTVVPSSNCLPTVTANDTAVFKKRSDNSATSTALDDKPPTTATATDITAPATDIIETARFMKSGNNCATRSSSDTPHFLSCEAPRPQLPQEAEESCDLTLAELPLLTVLAVNAMRCENMKIIHNTEQ